MSAPPPPAGYYGDHSRPLDPQYGGWQPARPQYLPPPRPRRWRDVHGTAIGVVIGAVVGIASTLVVLALFTSVGVPPTAPATVTITPHATLDASIVGQQYFSLLQSKNSSVLQRVACPGVRLGDGLRVAHVVMAAPIGLGAPVGGTATMPGVVLLDDGVQYRLQVSIDVVGRCVVREQKS